MSKTSKPRIVRYRIFKYANGYIQGQELGKPTKSKKVAMTRASKINNFDSAVFDKNCFWIQDDNNRAIGIILIEEVV